ncbi:MAG: Sua5/YciO/YrdC/YwlC family protein, partial [Cyclobacteriaceae bacterium]|nr:Sua5/YciO/YrdC/YwlC family protein [Cyclobacteriaceae bacterium]
MAIIGQDIAYAQQLLENGDVVAVPTETVYGLAGNALNDRAVTKIFTVKDRPYFDPLIVHVTSADEVKKYAAATPHEA